MVEIAVGMTAVVGIAAVAVVGIVVDIAAVVGKVRENRVVQSNIQITHTHTHNPTIKCTYFLGTHCCCIQYHFV
jgi:hypothetical protein